MSTCKPTGGRSWRDQNTLSIRFWQKLTQHLQQVEGAKSKCHNPNISVFVSPCAHIMKEEGEVVLGILLPPPAWGLATTTAIWLPLVLAIWLLHISHPRDQHKIKHYRTPLPGASGSLAQGRARWCTPASGAGEQAPGMQNCEPSPQLPGAFLNSLRHKHIRKCSIVKICT